MTAILKIISGGGRALRPQGGVFCIASSGHGLLDMFVGIPLFILMTVSASTLVLTLPFAMVFGWY